MCSLTKPGHWKLFLPVVQFNKERGTKVISRRLSTIFFSPDFGTHILLALQVMYLETWCISKTKYKETLCNIEEWVNILEGQMMTLRSGRHLGNSYGVSKNGENESLPAKLTRWKPFGMFFALSFTKPEPPTRSLSLNKHNPQVKELF